MKRSRSGFTLVEVMIVILIIGILLTIAVPLFRKARATSRQKVIVANLRAIDSAKEQCAFEKGAIHGDWQRCRTEVLKAEYIKDYPKDNSPVAGLYDSERIGTPADFRGHDADWWASNQGDWVLQ